MVVLNTSNPTIFENNKWIFLRNKTGFHILIDESDVSFSSKTILTIILN
jgi:hypothetical protein